MFRNYFVFSCIYSILEKLISKSDNIHCNKKKKKIWYNVIFYVLIINVKLKVIQPTCRR